MPRMFFVALRTWVLAIGLAAGLSGAANAVVVVTATEENGDVVFRTEGRVKLEGLKGLMGATNNNGWIIPSVQGLDLGAFLLGPIDQTTTTQYLQFGDPIKVNLPPFGGGPGNFQNFGTSGTGDAWGLLPGLLNLPADYDALRDLNSTLTYEGATFESLDMVVGSYTSVLLNDDTITLNVEAAPIPLPAALPMLATGLVGVAALGLRRRRPARRATGAV